MNQLITTAGQPATMSSREIAELTEKRHATGAESVGEAAAPV